MKKKLWNIFHGYDTDGGFGDAVSEEELIATVEATDDEIDAFVKEWNRPRIYAYPYNPLVEHNIYAREIKVTSINSVVPYPPEEKNKPDFPSKKPEYGKRWVFNGTEFVQKLYEEMWNT